MKKKVAPAIKETLSLYNEIKGRGLKIFLISSRGEHLRDATVNNLIKAGCYGWTGLILRYFTIPHISSFFLVYCDLFINL